MTKYFLATQITFPCQSCCTLCEDQGGINCGPSSHPGFIKNYFLSNFLYDIHPMTTHKGNHLLSKIGLEKVSQSAHLGACVRGGLQSLFWECLKEFLIMVYPKIGDRQHIMLEEAAKGAECQITFLPAKPTAVADKHSLWWICFRSVFKTLAVDV